jgi:hypothetical protein
MPAVLSWLEMVVTDQNLIHEEVKSKLNLGRTCYQSVQNLLFSHNLSKNLKIMLCRSTILLAWYGCKTWSPIVREEHRTMIYENKMFRRIFECSMRSYFNLYLPNIINMLK